MALRRGRDGVWHHLPTPAQCLLGADTQLRTERGLLSRLLHFPEPQCPYVEGVRLSPPSCADSMRPQSWARGSTQGSFVSFLHRDAECKCITRRPSTHVCPRAERGALGRQASRVQELQSSAEGPQGTQGPMVSTREHRLQGCNAGLTENSLLLPRSSCQSPSLLHPSCGCVQAALSKLVVQGAPAADPEMSSRGGDSEK